MRHSLLRGRKVEEVRLSFACPLQRDSGGEYRTSQVDRRSGDSTGRSALGKFRRDVHLLVHPAGNAGLYQCEGFLGIAERTGGRRGGSCLQRTGSGWATTRPRDSVLFPSFPRTRKTATGRCGAKGCCGVSHSMQTGIMDAFHDES